MKKIKRRQVVEDYVDFEGRTLKNAKEFIDSVIEVHGEEALFDIEYDYDDTKSLVVVVEREETDEEFAERMRQAARHEEWQRKQYEKLKAKFEGENS